MASLDYLPRVVDHELRTLLHAAGGVVVEGPRGCGKTETARRVAASEVRLDIDAAARQTAAIDPALLLSGGTPRLIDEWQVEPGIWNHVRRAIDDRQAAGQFILTGSSVPSDEITRHTGALRLIRMRMRPMSLFESGHSSGQMRLSQLMDGDDVTASGAGVTVGDLAELIAVGGWPGLHGRSETAAQRVLRSYVADVAETDASRVDGKRRDPVGLRAVINSLARNTATQVAASRIAADAGGADGSMREATVREYLEVLERLMVTENQPAWSPHIRSRTRARTAVKRHFTDPSLAVAALGSSATRLANDVRALGFLFESLAVRDLRVYAQACDGEVLHYRDADNREVDAVVQTTAGRWGAFEIKLGGEALIDQAAESLINFARQIDTEKCGSPGVLAVVVGTSGYGYRRPDGVTVVPIAALGP